MNKKIIGYKLIKPEYEKASDALLDNSCVKWDKAENFRGYYHLILNSETISNLKKAGVLDLWFEPVYEQTITPEYVELLDISSYNYGRSCGEHKPELNKIYKVSSHTENLKDLSLQVDRGWIFLVNPVINEDYIPSTKKAFDLQNQPKQKFKEVKTKQIFTKEQEDYIKNLINNEIKKLQ